MYKRQGLHGLNPVLLPKDVEKHLIFRMYVSALLPLNLDNHNRIPTSYLRLLRRIVRDYETRGASVSHTLAMWDSVRQGEERWIFPYQEHADVIFNSSQMCIRDRFESDKRLIKKKHSIILLGCLFCYYSYDLFLYNLMKTPKTKSIMNKVIPNAQ